jgi:uncharacterized membrane protein YqjE
MSNPQGGDSAGEIAGQNTGLFTALKNVSATLLATGRTRFELLSNEFEEEKLRAIRLLVLAETMVFCLAVGILLVVALLATLFWDNRIAVIGGFACLFLLLGFISFKALMSATQRQDKPFASSLAELEEDLRQLKSAARNESKAN